MASGSNPDERPAAPASGLQLASRIPADAHGIALIDYLLARFRYHDRSAWLGELRAGRLTVDGVKVPADYRLRAGASLVYTKVHREPEVPLDLPIIYDDAALLVVAKPALLPMHADGPFIRHTLIHVVRTTLGLPDAHLVHRLDRETSGVVVVAKSGPVRAVLERQFAAGEVEKTYQAIVSGAVAADFRVDAPIGHAAHSTIALRRSAAPDARDPRQAATDFAVERRGADRTLLRCTPHTGRTHQIRVHLEHAGYPLLGDKLYGCPDAHYLEFVARVKAGGDPRDLRPGHPPRQLLHAAEIALAHPLDGTPVRFRTDPPADFVAWLP